MAVIMEEAEVQELVNENKLVQEGIKNALALDDDFELIREDKYINGLTSDFTIIQDNKIKAIVECKSGNINVTDYVRGIGQLFQYEYFAEEKIPHKSYEYDDMKSFKTVYLFPSSVIINNQFNVATFKYPKSSILLELNEYNHAIREINVSELKKIKNEDDNLISISPYYFRDNRIFEYYILLNYLFIEEQKGIKKIDRKECEDNFLTKIETINNGNWRNAFITLSSLGFINRNNLLTSVGKNIAIHNYEDFALNMFHSYLKPYFNEIQKCFNNKKEIELNNIEFSNLIRNRFNGKDVLYLTQSNNRYISSWLNIMRDDYGILFFEPRKKLRKINYNPFELNDTTLKEKIKKYSNIAKVYIDKYQTLLRG